MRLVIGDLHISHKSDKVFEGIRLKALVEHLTTYRGVGMHLVLLGDTFDSNNPSLEDIQMFYWLINEFNSIFTSITIIAGNHDWKLFEYLPEVGFTYLDKPTIIGDVTFLPWTHLDSEVAKMTISNKKLGKVLLSHARCTIVPHIIEEVNIKAMSDSYDLVILGDIHMPHSPYPNCHYTSESSQHHYKTYTKNSTGYIILHDDNSFERVFTDLPYKCKLPECTVDDLVKLIPTLSPDNRYKIIVKDHVTNLQKLKKLKVPHVKFEAVPIVVQAEDTHGEALKAMVAGKISIEQLLFDYITENYKFDSTTSSKILKGIR